MGIGMLHNDDALSEKRQISATMAFSSLGRGDTLWFLASALVVALASYLLASWAIGPILRHFSRRWAYSVSTFAMALWIVSLLWEGGQFMAPDFTWHMLKWGLLGEIIGFAMFNHFPLYSPG